MQQEINNKSTHLPPTTTTTTPTPPTTTPTTTPPAIPATPAATPAHLLLLLRTASVYAEKLLQTAGFHTQQAFTHKSLYSHTETDALAEGIDISYQRGFIYIYKSHTTYM